MPKGSSGIKRGGKGGQIGKPAVSIPEAKTIAEANAIAVQYGLAKNADFGQLDISVANELMKEIAETRAMFSDVQELDFIGSTQAMKDFYGRSFRISSTFAAEYDEFYKNGAYRRAITCNEKLMSSKKIGDFMKDIGIGAATRFHPVGTDSIRAYMAHEVGHWLDYSLARVKNNAARNDTQIAKLYYSLSSKYRRDFEDLPNGRWRYTSKMAKELSEYGNKNIKEFIAEAWTEYRCSTSPRPIAKQVGERIIELYNGGVK